MLRCAALADARRHFMLCCAAHADPRRHIMLCCAARADPRRHFMQAPQQRRWHSEAAEAVQLAALRALLACSRERTYLLPRLRLIEAGPNLQASACCPLSYVV
jgi:hypothetical protein